MNKILVKNGLKKALAAEFTCTYPTVRTALNGVSRSDLSMRIRSKALELGGMEVRAVRRV